MNEKGESLKHGHPHTLRHTFATMAFVTLRACVGYRPFGKMAWTPCEPCADPARLGESSFPQPYRAHKGWEAKGKSVRREIITIGLAIIVFQATLAFAASEPDKYDVFYDDQTSATLNRLTVNIPQIHTISGAADEDWACFPTQEGLPHAIKVRAVAGGLDPELWVYPDGLAQPGMKTDYGSFGENEYYGLQRWPSTGLFYIKVRAAGIQPGPTTYTLVVTCDVGANCGLASISGTIVKSAQAYQDSLTLPKAVQLFDGTTTNPLYTLSQIDYPSGAFLPDALPDLMLSGMGDPISNLNRPWVTKWHQRFPSNFSITRVGIYPAILPTTPISLTIQMRTQPLQRNLMV